MPQDVIGHYGVREAGDDSSVDWFPSRAGFSHDDFDATWNAVAAFVPDQVRAPEGPLARRRNVGWQRTSVDPARAGEPTLGYVRPSNNAGGLEAGMTNGQPLVIRAAKKPIATLRKPLESINWASKEPQKAAYERSDVCAVPAASVIIEAVVAFEVAAALVDKFGGDSIAEMQARYQLFQEMARKV